MFIKYSILTSLDTMFAKKLFRATQTCSNNQIYSNNQTYDTMFHKKLFLLKIFCISGDCNVVRSLSVAFEAGSKAANMSALAFGILYSGVSSFTSWAKLLKIWYLT